MNAALSVILSVATVLAGGAAALGGDLLSPHSVPADDCVAGVCLGGGHGNATGEPGNETSGNGTAEPEPEPEPGPEEGNETGHHHHHQNETHHHHYHNGTAHNRTAEPEEHEDVHFCTSGLYLVGGGYEFTWEVHAGYERFELDWHFQSLALGLVTEPEVYVLLVDGAGDVVLEADGRDALSFHLGTEDLRGHAPGEWTFVVHSGELVSEQGLVGSVEY